MIGGEPPRARTGRRPGDSGTRDAIRDAARQQFARQGFDRTSMRSVALEAGVDPTLVSHFFGSKQRLFAEVMQLPFDPAQVLPHILAGDPAGIGARLAGFVVSVLSHPEGYERMTGLIRAAASEDAAAVAVRERVSRDILAPLAAGLGSDEPELRGSLAASQVVGLVMARHVVKIEPLASLPPDRVAALIAPTLQRYLVDPLP
ncbi:MAG TPA: TetR family transcriptional regulator [Mycobacteriales bacterium]|jgi:AcrR family transcriptional regulator|nr:TetR family transcriptional regulator [Mycobacteriales bacterium]